MIVPLVGSSYAERSLNLDAQTCINFYEVMDSTGKFPTALYPTPGLRLFLEITGSSVRGLFQENGILYIVIDNKFYTLNAAGVRVERGTLKTVKGRVSMISNGLQIMIADNGVYGYVYTLADHTFEQITNENFKAPLVLAYQDGYGIFPEPNTNVWWITDLFDFKVINATDFATGSGSADYVIGVLSVHEELWLFNDQTTEVWYNTGDATFTFQRRQTLLTEYGCCAPYSICKANNGQVFWLSHNRQGQALIVMTEGYVPKIISTPPIKQMIQDFERVDDAFAFTYELDGYMFMVMTFPSADRTLCYNITTGKWNEIRSTINNSLPYDLPTRQGRWRANCYAYFNGKHIVGDFESGNLYEITPDVYTENGQYIARERTGYHLQAELDRVFVHFFQFDHEAGIGLTSGQGSNPVLMFQVSRDSGHSWGNEKWGYAGKQGKYKDRLVFRQLGSSRGVVTRIRATDPVKWVILGAKADVERGEA